jgi:hypothetical protein
VSDFKAEHLANFGTGEPWVTRLMVDLPAIVDVTTHQNRDQVKEALAATFRALVDAYNDLRELRRIESDPSVPLSERDGAYSAFYVHLWRAYKGSFQQEVPAALGYDIGFLWQSDNEFEAGAERFLRDHTEVDSQLVDMMRGDRRDWESKLALFRNEHLEHKQELDPGFIGTFYTPRRCRAGFRERQAGDRGHQRGASRPAPCTRHQPRRDSGGRARPGYAAALRVRGRWAPRVGRIGPELRPRLAGVNRVPLWVTAAVMGGGTRCPSWQYLAPIAKADDVIAAPDHRRAARDWGSINGIMAPFVDP